MAYCIECGQKLIEGSNFCCNCGTQITQEPFNANKNINELQNIESKSKRLDTRQFSLFSNQILFDGNLISVIEVQKIFREFSWKKTEKFVELYNSKINTLDDLFDIGLPQFISDVSESINLGVEILLKHGVDHIDNSSLTDLASEYIDIEEVWKPIVDAAKKIEETADKLAMYRNVQRASRSRWQGGGFGITGAMKGALTAGAMNITTSAFRGIGDSLTNSSDRAKIAKMKKNVISNGDTLSILRNGIYNCCLDIFSPVYEILYDEGILVYDFEDMKNQNARLNNYLQLHHNKKLDTNELVSFLCECIQKHPFDRRYYVELYKLNLANRKDILPIASFVGMKGEYQYTINILDELTISQIDEKMPESTILELEKKCSLLKEMQAENEELFINDYIEKYKKRIDELEEKNNIQKKIQDTLGLLQKSKMEIDNALENGNIIFVWNKVEEGNIYSQYALTRYYSNLCEKDIVDYDVSSLNTKLSEVEAYANAGNIFAKYIINDNLYTLYTMNRRNTYLARESAKIIIDIANKNNNISALTKMGYWGCHGYNNATPTKADGVKVLIKCAELYHPPAMAWLGSYYRTGEYGLPIDINQARYYLTIAADFGHPYAIKELEKLNHNNTSRSSCYITTAVCSSFGKSDDCYELQAFRNFRDDWLKKQSGGESLIQEYYETAPQIIEKIDLNEDSSTIYRYIWETYLSKCLSFIEMKQFEECKHLYICMVEDMRHKYV